MQELLSSQISAVSTQLHCYPDHLVRFFFYLQPFSFLYSLILTWQSSVILKLSHRTSQYILSVRAFRLSTVGHRAFPVAAACIV